MILKMMVRLYLYRNRWASWRRSTRWSRLTSVSHIGMPSSSPAPRLILIFLSLLYCSFFPLLLFPFFVVFLSFYHAFSSVIALSLLLTLFLSFIPTLFSSFIALSLLLLLFISWYRSFFLLSLFLLFYCSFSSVSLFLSFHRSFSSLSTFLFIVLSLLLWLFLSFVDLSLLLLFS